MNKLKFGGFFGLTCFALGIALTTIPSSSAQNIFCKNARPLTLNSGQTLFLEHGRNRLTHYWLNNHRVPVLVYLERDPLHFRDLVHVKESGSDDLLSVGTSNTTAQDHEFTLNTISPLLGHYDGLKIDSFDVFDRYIVLGVSDGRRGLIPEGSLNPAQVIIVELTPGTPPGQEIARAYVAASYPVMPHTNSALAVFPRIADVRIDHDVNTLSQVPLVAWSYTIDSGYLGAPDELYYCRLNACDPTVAGGGPIGSGIFAPFRTQWYGVKNIFVTESITANPLFMFTAKPRLGTSVPPLIGNDIFTAELNTSNVAQGWLNSQSGAINSRDGKVLGFSAQFSSSFPVMFYSTPNTLGMDRINLAIQNQAPATGALPLFANDPFGGVGKDTNFQLSGVGGVTLANYPNYPTLGEAYMTWDREGTTLRIPGLNGGEKVTESDLQIASISSILNSTSPVSIRSVANLLPSYAQNFFVYGEAVSQNQFIVTAVPDPRVNPMSYFNLFRDPARRTMAWTFSCAE